MINLALKRQIVISWRQFQTAFQWMILMPMLVLCIARAQQPVGTRVQTLQSDSQSKITGCVDMDQKISPEIEHSDAANPGQRVQIAHLNLNTEIAISVTENRVTIGNDDFAPLLEITQGHQKNAFPLKQYIKYGDSLHLRRLRSICAGPDQGMLILAFEAGSTDALQGFAFVKFSGSNVLISAVPIVQQGRVEIKRDQPYEFDLWEADKRFQGECDACTKRYSVRHCKVIGPRSQCVRLDGPLLSREPNEITGDLIRVH